ncbi:MAG: BlaI/MecI/CopY family transcriptional regulator [Anaerolineae bacterium]|nr:BlaI/MecI/CopY family transcriptional regulator [Anaerolineae bacterium]
MEKHIKQLTDLQMDVMQVLWQQSEATVSQVHAALHEERQLAMTTVATLLSRLEKYGLLTHRAEGRQYVYRPLVSQSEVRRSQLTDLIDQFFHGNPADLVYHLINEAEVDDEDLARLQVLIESKE